MKNFFAALFSLVTIAFLSTGCPVGLDYPIANPGSDKIDKKLIGTWVATSSGGEIQKVEVTKKDANSYAINVLETGEMYSLEGRDFEGWTTNFEGKKFLYARLVSDEEKYYHYEYDIEDGKLVTHDVSLLVNGIDGVTSIENLRTEVKESLKNPDCLTSRMEYTKE